MSKKGSISGQFAADIKGFEELYKFIFNIFDENKWSMSFIHHITRRFVEGFKYDGITQENIDLADLKNRIYKIRKNQFDRQSKEYFVNQYGENLGLIKFKELQEKQAYTNSKEYKGMTDEEFDEYNKSRAVTKNLCIKRHGEDEGLKIWDEYRHKQAYTNSLEYFVKKFGKDEGVQKWKIMNFQKGHSADSYIDKYGEVEGTQKYIRYCETRNIKFSSKIASSLFEELDNYFKFNKVYYSPKTQEFGKYDKEHKCYYYYDFVLPDIKLCIEFNGDVFHANPKFFTESDNPNPFDTKLTAKEIWDYDKRKLDLLIKNNYNIIIIWEHDYKNDKEKVINNLKNIIRGEYDSYNKQL